MLEEVVCSWGGVGQTEPCGTRHRPVWVRISTCVAIGSDSTASCRDFGKNLVVSLFQTQQWALVESEKGKRWKGLGGSVV